jgi:hypothetical protein
VNEIELNKNTYLFLHRFLVGMVIVVIAYTLLSCVYMCVICIYYLYLFFVIFLDNIVLFDEWSEFVMNLI